MVFFMLIVKLNILLVDIGIFVCRCEIMFLLFRFVVIKVLEFVGFVMIMWFFKVIILLDL